MDVHAREACFMTSFVGLSVFCVRIEPLPGFLGYALPGFTEYKPSKALLIIALFPIDQRSFRTKGTVVVFGLTKFSSSHWLSRGGEEGGGVGMSVGRIR